ncbi:MAG: UTP--glucose-1-phosphate uridylyltransferase [Deltaproteobacteria bacterium]|nr:MAG: UTP--glucose-1-phosphate uridylyltransferase [Deltaproteobacteria bacterium]
MKAVILAAGYGTRFLPVTKVVPKELLPIMERPALDLVVDELVEAGVDDLLIITSRRKKAVEDWFDHEAELEAVFTREGADAKLAKIRPRDNLKVTFIRQRTMQGTGHALLHAKDFAGNEPVVVAYPDDLFGPPNPTAALIAHYERTGRSVLAAADFGEADVSAYGVLAPKGAGADLLLERIVEKPPPGEEPSKLVSYGRYLYTPDFFEALERHYATHTGKEYYHVPALLELAAGDKVGIEVLDSHRYDTGTPLQWLETTLAFALRDPETGDEVRAMMQRMLG